MARSDVIQVNEYVDGVMSRTWDSISECAMFYKISVYTLKCLIATGNPLYYESDHSITYDLPVDSPYSIRMIPTDNSPKKEPMVITDVPKVLRQRRII